MTARALPFAESVVNYIPFGETLQKSAYYIIGAVAYIIVPLIFLAALRPNRAALADIVWPADEDRRQAWVLLIVPLILPALVNLAIPYRLTPDWTFPNWAALPIVLYGSRHLLVDDRAVARGGLAALVVTLAIVLASPVVACVRLASGPDVNRPHFRQVAERAELLAGRPIELMWGSEGIVPGLPFYLPNAQRLIAGPSSAEGRAAIATHGLLIVCTERRRAVSEDRRIPRQCRRTHNYRHADAPLPRRFQPADQLSDHGGAAGAAFGTTDRLINNDNDRS